MIINWYDFDTSLPFNFQSFVDFPQFKFNSKGFMETRALISKQKKVGTHFLTTLKNMMLMLFNQQWRCNMMFPVHTTNVEQWKCCLFVCHRRDGQFCYFSYVEIKSLESFGFMFRLVAELSTFWFREKTQI